MAVRAIVAPRVCRTVGAALLLLCAAPAIAQPAVVAGLVFSDEDGGFTIVGAWGEGTLEDPIVIVEEIVEPRPVTLVIRGFSPTWGNKIPTNHPAGFAIRKIVINRTANIWNSYDNELQIVRGTPSDIYDGLSFGQASEAGRPFLSDHFASATMQDEPRDYVTFGDGEVRPGEMVTFQFVITATSPVEAFYLVQDPNRPIAGLLTGARPRRG